MTSGEREAAGIDEIFRSEPHVCVETFVRSNLEIRKKEREKGRKYYMAGTFSDGLFSKFFGKHLGLRLQTQ